MMFVVLLFGMTLPTTLNVGFIYLLEFFPTKKHTRIGVLYAVTDACIYPLGTIYFWLISNYWAPFSAIGYLLCLFTTVAVWWLPESPRVLIDLCRVEEAQDSIDTMKRWNGNFVNEATVRFNSFRQPSVTSESSTVEAPTIRSFLEQRPILINLVVLSLAWTVTVFNWYLVQFLVNTFDEVYLSAIGSAVSDIIGYTFGGILFYRFGIQASLMISFAVATLGGVAILLYGVDNSGDAIFSILVFLAKFGISCAF